jgi:hypothetical protein
MASSASGTHSKGASIRSFLGWYERSQDRERVIRAIRQLPPEHRLLLDADRDAFGVLPSRWYPSELVHALVDALTAGLSEEQLDRLARDGARVIIKDGLNGVYKMIFDLLVTPERYARHSHRIWRMFHDTGSTDVVVVGPREQRARITDRWGHHPFICRLNRASTAVLYGEMKCRNVVLTDEGCVARGDRECVSLVRWD